MGPAGERAESKPSLGPCDRRLPGALRLVGEGAADRRRSACVPTRGGGACSRSPASAGTIAVLLGSVLSGAIKEMVGRLRPPFADPSFIAATSAPDTPSFPSGHTTTAFAAAAAVGVFYPRLRLPLSTAWPLWWASPASTSACTSGSTSSPAPCSGSRSVSAWHGVRAGSGDSRTSPVPPGAAGSRARGRAPGARRPRRARRRRLAARSRA